MDKELTIRDCTDEAGNFDAEKFNAYRKQRDSVFDESTELPTKFYRVGTKFTEKILKKLTDLF